MSSLPTKEETQLITPKIVDELDEPKQKVAAIAKTHHAQQAQYERRLTEFIDAYILRRAVNEYPFDKRFSRSMREDALAYCDEVASAFHKQPLDNPFGKDLLSTGLSSIPETEASMRRFFELVLGSLVVEPWRENDSNRWEPHKDATRFAQELLATTEVDLGAGVTMLQLTTFLQAAEADALPQFIRPESKQLVQTLVRDLISGKHKDAVIIGPSGIGKSRSLMLVLRQVLKLGLRVIFESRKDDMVYAFIPGTLPGQIRAYSCPKPRFMPGVCTVLKDSNTFYLIDADRPETSVTSVIAKTVLAAFSNPDHFHHFQKHRGAKKYTMKPWSLEELLAVKNFATSNSSMLSDKKVAKRYRKFGGELRLFFYIDR